MRRILLALAAASLLTTAAFAGAPAPPRPVAMRFAASPVVVVGKVTAIEKETVDAEPFPGSKQKVAYKMAVVKITDGIAGAANLTHVKVGFIPPVKVDPNVEPGIRPRPAPYALQLKEGQEVLLFLHKHPSADFHMMSPWQSPSIDLGTEQAKKELETVKRVAALLADPMKGLKSDKADMRAETAATLVMKYRAYPEGTTSFEEVSIPAEENKLILRGLAEGAWKQEPFDNSPTAVQAFYLLNLTDKDGWKPPAFPQPKPGEAVDFAAIQKEAFAKWLAGPGKDYTIKKVVAKK